MKEGISSCTFKEGLAGYSLGFSVFPHPNIWNVPTYYRVKARKKNLSLILLKNTVFCTQTFIVLRTFLKWQPEVLKMCMDMVQYMYIYIQVCICTSNVYIHIQACSLMNLNLIIQQCTLLYIQYEMSCFMDVKESKPKPLRSFKPEHNLPNSTLNLYPWLIDGEQYQPQTDCLKAHTNVFGVCVYF